MNDLFRRYGNLLRIDGTNQLQRSLPALELGYIVPDERNLSDLLNYALDLAAEIRFYDLTGRSAGDWLPFLEPLVDVDTKRIQKLSSLEATLDARQDWPPHITLFLVFLKLFQSLQSDLNELPQRHLRYYYESELGLSRRGAVADSVHVVFELARNAASTLLPAGTLLDAGKDSQGNLLRYATRHDIVASNAVVSDIRRLIVEKDGHTYRRFFVADSVTEVEGKSWNTFGSTQLTLDTNQRYMSEAKLGFAIASPVLRLAEGVRSIEVTALLRGESGRELPSAQGIGYTLDVALTGDKGWLAPDNFTAELLDTDGTLSLRLQVFINAIANAITAFNSDLHGAGPDSEWPVLRCLIKGQTGIYETLERLTIDAVKIRVGVEGVHKLVVQNADGPLSADGPMPLFGNQPRIGSPFYIGSAEVFSKKLSYLAVNLEWKSPPNDLFGHYKDYFDTTDNDLSNDFRANFLCDIDMLYDRTWDHPLQINRYLFSPAVVAPQKIATDDTAINWALRESRHIPHPEMTALEPYTPASILGFIRLTLSGPARGSFNAYVQDPPFEAFGHQAFPRRYANQAIALSKWDSGSGTAKPILPNEPYTPVLARVSLDYQAEASFVPGDVHAYESLFTLGPFGYTAADKEVKARLVPIIDGNAALYLGVDKVQAPANLSLLFQIDTGTASADKVLKLGETHWSYLKGGLWRALPSSAVLNDTTYGFQKPGLVVISVSKEATTRHTAMPTDLIWLRAHIDREPASAARTLALHSQATLAEFAVNDAVLGDYTQHLQQGLAAQIINRLQQRNSAIKQVAQPYGSFGGRGPEDDADYFRRCSERLRHRNRAITPWDFERLVLEAFPEVFKVKCLPHSDAYGKSKAGETALVIIPDLRRVECTNPLEPRASAVLMERINAYVNTNLATPFSKLHVIHPLYERIRVDIHVAFKSGVDAGWYASVLNEDLRRFLSPWSYSQGEDIVFGARVYKSEILGFLESRDYIDYVTDFNLYHSYDGPPRDGIAQMAIGFDFVIRPDPHPAIAEMVVGEDFVVGRSVDVAYAALPHAILVSHPAHFIAPISPGEDRCIGVTQLGIGYMTVSLDFKVQPEYV